MYIYIITILSLHSLTPVYIAAEVVSIPLEEISEPVPDAYEFLKQSPSQTQSVQ